jgi:hypothetical protein
MASKSRRYEASAEASAEGTKMQTLTDELATVEPGQLVGARARLVLQPEAVGLVTAVHFYDAGRMYTFRWLNDGNVCSADLNGFELELVDG